MKRYWLSILILAAGIVFPVVISGYSLLPLLHLPSFIITVVTPFFLVTILFGFKETCRVFAIIRKNENEHDTLMSALAFFRVYGKATWFSAIIASLAGGIGTLVLLEDPASIGPNLALALVGLLYCGVVQLAIIIPYTILIHKQLGSSKIRGDMFHIFGSLFGVIFVLLLCLFIFVPDPSQESVQTSNQINPVDLSNVIRDKATVGGRGRIEYELYDVPGNGSSDFKAFLLSYTQTLEEYVFDHDNHYWIEDNTLLNFNVKTIYVRY